MFLVLGGIFLQKLSFAEIILCRNYPKNPVLGKRNKVLVPVNVSALVVFLGKERRWSSYNINFFAAFFVNITRRSNICL
jgi:hypothetical protein